MRQTATYFGSVLIALLASAAFAAEPSPNFTRDVAPILAKYCAGCHNNTDREGELSVESFAELQKGGANGAVFVAGNADASFMVRAIRQEVEPAMPPEDNPRPTDGEVEILRAWINAGAIGPKDGADQRAELKVPSIAPAAGVHAYLSSMALSPDGKRLALGSYKSVKLIEPGSGKVLAEASALPGKVNNITFSADGSLFVASSGAAGQYGIAMMCNASDGSPVREFRGHHDAIYDAVLSPDSKLLATCSYDRSIILWDVPTGALIRELSGHNGAVYDVAFSPDGSLLATASADQTVKIWNVRTGERFDTLGQPEGEQNSVAFSPNSEWIIAAGSDRQVRTWSLVSREKAAINPLKQSRTAHNSAILKLAVSPDGTKLVTASEGRELVLWNTATLTPYHRFEQQPDVPTGLAFAPDGQSFYIARIDGSWHQYQLPMLEAESVAASEPAAVDQPADGEESKNAAPVVAKEQEPNNAPANANAISSNSRSTGTISAVDKNAPPDVDLFRFHATKGQQLVLEIKAARDKSPLDSKLEVLDAAGKPVPRVILQAVRSSYYTFRGHDSTDVNDFRMHGALNMELNQYVYAAGEVMKLWLLPQGPDSGFLVYPGTGKNRFTYFGSTAITHALNDPVYIVEPHQPGATLIPNGLPTFTMYYENDDDGWRIIGADSRIAFTAPADGDYFVRVSDIRGMGGDNYRYELTARPAQPDFEIKVTAKDLTINAGSGKEFTITANRKDEFDGQIDLKLSKLPPGFHVTTPLSIQAGQTVAYGTITADADAPAISETAKPIKIVASAVINGKPIRKKAVKLGELKLVERPKFLVRLLPATPGAPTEISISPGETISALLKVERNGFDGEIKFGGALAGRNLPHGVYVDNIGLNGVMLLAGESERKIFLTARKWVEEQSRPFHLQADVEGKQTSLPVMLRVRNSSGSLPQQAKDGVALAPEQN